MKTQFQFIYFTELPTTGKTSKWSCRNNHSGEQLGEVKWYGAWRQYCYFSTVQAVYSVGCMEDINTFITKLKAGDYERDKP